MSEVASDLADTSKEKFAKLAEEIEWSDCRQLLRQNVKLLKNHTLD